MATTRGILLLPAAFLLAWLQSRHAVSSFPQGAPAEVCESLLPRHVGTQPSGESSPFYLSASSGRYGGVFGYSKARGIKVELGGAPFRGFFIVAIDPKTGQRIGSWAQVKGTETLPCAGITHTNAKSKKYAALLWTPPAHEQGFVTFIATVVQSFSKYYMNLVATTPELPPEPSPGEHPARK